MILSNERNTFQYPILSILELKMHSHKKKTTFHFSPFFPIKLEKQTSSSKITLPLDDDPKFHLEEERDWPRSSSKHVRANLILSVVATEKKEKKKKVLGGRRLSSRLGNYSFSRRRSRGVSNSKAATFLICLFHGVGCWPVGSAPNGPVLLHKSCSLQEGGRASSECRGLYCIPVCTNNRVSLTPIYSGAIYSRIRVEMDEWSRGLSTIQGRGGG